MEKLLLDFSIVGKSDFRCMYLILTKTSDCDNISTKAGPACRAGALSQHTFMWPSYAMSFIVLVYLNVILSLLIKHVQAR